MCFGGHNDCRVASDAFRRSMGMPFTLSGRGPQGMPVGGRGPPPGAVMGRGMPPPAPNPFIGLEEDGVAGATRQLAEKLLASMFFFQSVVNTIATRAERAEASAERSHWRLGEAQAKLQVTSGLWDRPTQALCPPCDKKTAGAMWMEHAATFWFQGIRAMTRHPSRLVR